VNARYKQLNRDRQETFFAHFKDRKLDKQIKFAPGASIIPYNGFSFYRIEYNGAFPKFLMKAYWRMNDLNDNRLSRNSRRAPNENLPGHSKTGIYPQSK
jgi:hypothetical protein